MTRIFICIAICAVIWIANGVSIIHGLRKRIPNEVYMHTGLALFLSLLTIELCIGINGAWHHLNIKWISVTGFILYIPSFIIIISSMIALKHKGKSKGADFTESTIFLDTGIYGYIRQPMTLGFAIWSLALILVFQSVPAFIIGLLSVLCFRLSAINEKGYNIKKFGDRYKKYMEKIPMWNIFQGLLK
ncbi:MAG: hypothetical protein JXN64_07025 [Spirochaetes bacterium]|nr:hypothetical protein [Spirochaetota bacterium]